MKLRFCSKFFFTLASLSLLFVSAPAEAIEASTDSSSGLKIAAPKPAKAVWISPEAREILKLVRAKVANEVVMAYIKTSRNGFNLSADEIIQLHNEGVSDEMINEMLARKKQAPAQVFVQQQPAAIAQAPQQQTVVQQPGVTYVQQPQTVYVPAPTTYIYREPVYTYYNPYPYYWSSYYYPRVSFNFGFGRGWYGHYGGHYGYRSYGHLSGRHYGGGFHGHFRR